MTILQVACCGSISHRMRQGDWELTLTPTSRCTAPLSELRIGESSYARADQCAFWVRVVFHGGTNNTQDLYRFRLFVDGNDVGVVRMVDGSETILPGSRDHSIKGYSRQASFAQFVFNETEVSSTAEDMPSSRRLQFGCVSLEVHRGCKKLIEADCAGATRDADVIVSGESVSEKEKIKGGRGVRAGAGFELKRQKRQWRKGEAYIGAISGSLPIAQLRLHYRDCLWWTVHERRQRQEEESCRRAQKRGLLTLKKEKLEEDVQDGVRVKRRAAPVGLIDLTRQ